MNEESYMNYQKELDLLLKFIPNIFLETEKQERQISYKKKSEIVTSSDLFIERSIINLVLSVFPNDHFHSEEFNRDTLIQDRTWFIDPIDGTSNYAHNLDMFVIQIALYDQGDLVLSYIYAPRVNKIFYAVKGEGAYLNGKRIHTSSTLEDKNRLLSLVGISHDPEKDKSLFYQMIDFANKERIKVRILGSLGFELSELAEGSFTLLYTDVTNYWDIAPGVLLVREAGGIFINELGEPYKLGENHMIACADETIKNKIIEKITHQK